MKNTLWFQQRAILQVAINNIIRRESLTKEAVDDPEEAAHGANDRGHDLVSPLDLLVAPQHLLAQAQQLAGGRHGGPKFRRGVVGANRVGGGWDRLCERRTGSAAVGHSNVSIYKEVVEKE